MKLIGQIWEQIKAYKFFLIAPLILSIILILLAVSLDEVSEEPFIYPIFWRMAHMEFWGQEFFLGHRFLMDVPSFR